MNILKHPFFKFSFSFDTIHIKYNNVEMIFDYIYHITIDDLEYTSPYSLGTYICAIHDSNPLMYSVVATNGKFELNKKEARIIIEQLYLLYTGAFEIYGNKNIITHYETSRMNLSEVEFEGISFDAFDLHRFPSMDVVDKCVNELEKLDIDYVSKIELARFRDHAYENYYLYVVREGDDYTIYYKYVQQMSLDDYNELITHIGLLGKYNDYIDPDVYFENLRIYHNGKQKKRVANI